MGKVASLTTKEWQDKVVEGKGLILLDFFASWCGPCKAFAPVLEEVAAAVDGECAIYKINIEEQEKLTEIMKIESVPTLILVRDGSEIARHVGPMRKKQLVDEIKKHS